MADKKSVAIVIPSLSSGGAEKSLVNLLNAWDFDRAAVYLIVLKREGILLDSVPTAVHWVDLPKNYHRFTQSLPKACWSFFKAFQWGLLWNRIRYTWAIRQSKNVHHGEQTSWPFLRSSIGVLPQKFDAAIGYLEKTSLYFTVDCVAATNKAGFIRTDYSKLQTDLKLDQNYFEALSVLLTNGNPALQQLLKTFPQLKVPTDVVLNTVSAQWIMQQAGTESPFKKETIHLVSIGRLDLVKGYDWAIQACKILIEKGYDLQWHVIGEGSYRSSMELQIKELQLENHFLLWGEKLNPYPFLKYATLFVQCSRFEGRSSTVIEAKILHKPIVITNFETANELIQSGENGLIVTQNPEAIAEGIEKMITDKDFSERCILQLQNEGTYSTKNEIEKLYKLIKV